MLKFVQTVNGYLADYILIILLIGTGIYFTVRTRFVQIRCFGEGMKKVFGNFSLHGGKQHGGISSFQALTTAIAAQVGTGNIVGASGAICLLFFAFSTILSWNFFGKLNVQYLCKNKKAALLIYSIMAIAFIFLGSLLSNDLVWELTDFFNYLMVLPNAIALIALGSLVASEAQKGEAAWKSQKSKKN